MINLQLTEGASTKPFEKELETAMNNDLQLFEKELNKIRTGRAQTSMIEDVRVMAYGTSMKLKELASISAPEVSLLVVQPWDKNLLVDIEKALSATDLGTTPLNDGSIIRIAMPRMSNERRVELKKLASKKTEDCKVALRNTRKDYQNAIRAIEKDKKVSEDYARRLTDLLQTITDKFIVLADKAGQKKEQEITTL